MKKSLEASKAVRAARKGRMFGADASCVICGFSNPAALRKANISLLEEHHIHGANVDDKTRVTLCRNCHALLTHGIMDAGGSMRSQQSLFETLAEVHRTLQVYHRFSSVAHEGFADELKRRVTAFDDRLPDWRKVEAGL